MYAEVATWTRLLTWNFDAEVFRDVLEIWFVHGDASGCRERIGDAVHAVHLERRAATSTSLQRKHHLGERGRQTAPLQQHGRQRVQPPKLFQHILRRAPRRIATTECTPPSTYSHLMYTILITVITVIIIVITCRAQQSRDHHQATALQELIKNDWHLFKDMY